MMVAALKMVPPADLREFQKRLDRISGARTTALEYIQFEDIHANAAEVMKRSKRAFLDCGRDFVWCMESGAWKDRYESWDEFCKAVKFNRRTVFRMMAGARAFDKQPPAAQETLGILSGRQLTTFAEADEDERNAVVEQIAAGATVDDAFAELRKQLDEAPEEVIDEFEVPEQPKVRDFAWVQKQCTTILNHFERRGALAEAKQFINVDALIALEERLTTGN